MTSNIKEVYARDIFGGSDSELSSEEEDVPQQRRRVSPEAPPDEYESSVASADEDYVQEKRAPPPKRRIKPRDDDDDEPRRPVQKKRKRKPVQVQEQDLSELPPEQASKLRLDMQIEAILKPKKAQRPKKRKKDTDEDILDRAADEEVSQLRENMLAAAAADIEANQAKQPATAKLRLLPEVEKVLLKNSLAASIMDNNLLEGVRRWLEPLPDRSLPALNIQRTFFEALEKMYIDTNSLKESKLGRVVLFYTKCRRVTPPMARLANKLVATWSRPIVKRSASYRDRPIPTVSASAGAGVDSQGVGGAGAARAGERLNTILARAREEEKGRARKNAVMIPRRELPTYTVAPSEMGGVRRGNDTIDHDVERRRKNAERLRSLTRKMAVKG